MAVHININNRFHSISHNLLTILIVRFPLVQRYHKEKTDVNYFFELRMKLQFFKNNYVERKLLLMNRYISY